MGWTLKLRFPLCRRYRILCMTLIRHLFNWVRLLSCQLSLRPGNMYWRLNSVNFFSVADLFRERDLCKVSMFLSQVWWMTSDKFITQHTRRPAVCLNTLWISVHGLPIFMQKHWGTERKEQSNNNKTELFLCLTEPWRQIIRNTRVNT
jgi:hypothetical protein